MSGEKLRLAKKESGGYDATRLASMPEFVLANSSCMRGRFPSRPITYGCESAIRPGTNSLLFSPAFRRPELDRLVFAGRERGRKEKPESGKKLARSAHDLRLANKKRVESVFAEGQYGL